MTDLDSIVLARALVYAVTTIDNLPEEKRVRGERDDMVHLLNLMIQDPVQREELAAEVEKVTGRLADLTDWRARDWRLE
jgi:hypothetical protein